MGAEGLDALIQYEAQRCVEAEYPGDVQRAGLEPVGHIGRKQLAVRCAACATGYQRLDPLCELLIKHQRAYALGAQKPLMAGNAQRR